MRIDKNELVADVPLLRVRDLLQYIGRQEFTALLVAERLELSNRKAASLVKELLAREWIAKADDRVPKGPALYQVTNGGRRLAQFRAVPRITKAKAEALLNAFVERCEQIDQRDELGYYVQEARVFGSFLTDAEDLGDLDLFVSIKQRPIPGRDVVEYSIARAESAGRNLDFLGMIGYTEIEVLQLLKHRSPYISLHTEGDPIAAAASSKVVFGSKKFSLKDGKPVQMSSNDNERWLESSRYSFEHPAFTGNLEFDIAFAILGQKFTRRARANYTWTPAWEYFDLHKNAPFTSLEGSRVHFEVLAIPENHSDEGEGAGDDDDPADYAPRWIGFDIAEDGVLPRDVWDAVYDAIDAQCKVEDLRRRSAIGTT